MPYKAWLYKGKESKIFDSDGLKEAMMQGWVDNPADANRSPEELLADLEVLEKAKRAALEEAKRLASEEKKQKKIDDAAASGATTLKN